MSIVSKIPKTLYRNKISEALDKIRLNYGILARHGYIYGQCACPLHYIPVYRKDKIFNRFFIEIYR